MPGTADFLADFVDDEDVDVGQFQPGHFGFGHGLQGSIAFKEFICRDDFQGGDVIAGALDHADGENDVYMLQEGFRYAFQVGPESVITPAVEGRSAFVLAAADADHLQQT
jgi:hypothetical protein